MTQSTELTPQELNVANKMATGTQGQSPIRVRLVEDTENHTIYQLSNGKFEKEMKIKKQYTKVPETDEEVMELFKLFNSSGDDENVIPFVQAKKGTIITIKNFFVNPYASFNEETGELKQGMTLMIEDESGKYYVTSSKTAYYALMNIFNAFHLPNTVLYKPVQVEITKTKSQSGNNIQGLKLVGFA